MLKGKGVSSGIGFGNIVVLKKTRKKNRKENNRKGTSRTGIRKIS